MIYEGSEASLNVPQGLWVKTPDDVEVITLSRSSSPSELVFGPLWFCSLLIWLGMYYFDTEQAAIVVAATGVGDGVAPLIGALFGRHHYHVPLANRKTMEGSVVGVFLGTASACYFYLYAMGIPFPPLRMILVYATIASVVEGTSPSTLDNVTVPIALLFSMDRIQEWMPS